MGQKIDQFCTDLNKDLTQADNRLQHLKAQLETANQESRDAIQAKLDEAKSSLEHQKQNAKDREHQIKSYLEEKKAEAQHDIADWKKRREIKKLEKRAERREEYAGNTVLIAMAAIDEAHVALLEALDARLDADEAEASA